MDGKNTKNILGKICIYSFYVTFLIFLFHNKISNHIVIKQIEYVIGDSLSDINTILSHFDIDKIKIPNLVKHKKLSNFIFLLVPLVLLITGILLLDIKTYSGEIIVNCLLSSMMLYLFFSNYIYEYIYIDRNRLGHDVVNFLKLLKIETTDG